MQEIGLLAQKLWMWWPLKNYSKGPIFGSSKFCSTLNGRLGDPMRGMTPLILTRLPIDLKLLANQPGWIFTNLQIPHKPLSER